jgi:hypothetical protein
VDIVLLVGPELLHELRVLEEGDDGGGGRVERLEPGEHLGAARDHVGGDVVGAVERLVDVHGVVDHVRAVEEADLRLEDLLVLVELPLLQELEQRKHQVAVQLRRHERREVVVPHGRPPRQSRVRVSQVWRGWRRGEGEDEAGGGEEVV